MFRHKIEGCGGLVHFPALLACVLLVSLVCAGWPWLVWFSDHSPVVPHLLHLRGGCCSKPAVFNSSFLSYTLPGWITYWLQYCSFKKTLLNVFFRCLLFLATRLTCLIFSPCPHLDFAHLICLTSFLFLLINHLKRELPCCCLHCIFSDLYGIHFNTIVESR